MNLYRTFLLFTFVMISSSPGAALIDHGYFTTDTDTGLRWLDLTQTLGQPILPLQPGEMNPGWRLATNQEVEGLFFRLFDGYYDTDAASHISDSREFAYGDQNLDVQVFLELFGATYTAGPLSHATGLYADENGVIRALFVTYHYGDDYSMLSGLDFTSRYPMTKGSDRWGVFYVSPSVIPLPAAIWLFAPGLLVILRVAWCKK